MWLQFHWCNHWTTNSDLAQNAVQVQPVPTSVAGEAGMPDNAWWWNASTLPIVGGV